MPAYEYLCRACDRTFTVLMSISDHDTKQVQCPHCQGTQVEQRLTPFMVKTSKKS
jgi:putative FmdB family regulatory protein